MSRTLKHIENACHTTVGSRDAPSPWRHGVIQNQSVGTQIWEPSILKVRIKNVGLQDAVMMD